MKKKSYIVVYGILGRDANYTITSAIDVEIDEHMNSINKMNIIFNEILREHRIQYHKGTFNVDLFNTGEIVIKTLTLI